MEKIKDISEEAQMAQKLLTGNNITLIDAARLIKNILDFMPKGSNLTDVQFCTKIIETGKAHFRLNEMSFANGFNLYYETKKDILRPDSLRDIRYLANRLMRSNPQLANRNFSELNASECESWLNNTFSTPSQHNKGRSFLHAIFEFAIRREWCDKNPIKHIERKKVVEKEIIPLKLSETKRLIKTARNESPKYAMIAALLVYAGIRPREVRRLSWRDIDTEENTITVRSQCSKTGGVRHVEISPILNSLLIVDKTETHSPVCPADWQRRWRKIRDNSGFKGLWVQDVLRHTYASYFTKRYSDLPRLQLNMGHRDLSLLRSRYINMQNISKADAKEFFG